MEYDNTNKGAIWRNSNKKTEKHPDFKGSLNVDGKDYWVSCWKKQDDTNPTLPVLTFQVNEKKKAFIHPQKTPPSDYDLNDDIPF